MIRIPCPHCGLRDHSEFTYLGDATVRRPPLQEVPNDDTPARQWFDYLYYRANPRGPHEELWHHSHGCRSWLVVTRDTLSHTIAAVRTARDAGREQEQ